MTGPPGAQDPASRRAFARSLLDALSDRHVLAGLTGPGGAVLKVRPPLIWDTGHADLFAAAPRPRLAYRLTGRRCAGRVWFRPWTRRPKS
ncbi:MAG TPA: hypothetical protein VFV73_00605 [Streptosporangiaceae bacterium]|nr:hypothetical protein [Streptosporangiaceae bacterium]